MVTQRGIEQHATCLFLFPPSDPYVKVTLYDPVNGVLTSIQTKTIRKVSYLICVGVVGFLWGLWYCVEFFFKSDSRGKVETVGNTRMSFE